jgi:L-threonylcarbamoyladenylate synthase
VESTILDLTRTPPVVLRPGGVPLEQLRELAPDLTYTPRYLAHDENAAAPGMLLRHYSPRAELLLWGGDDALPAMLTAAREALAAGRRVGVLVSDDDMPTFSTLDVERAALGVGSDVDAVARALFAGLRALDARGVDVILARGVGRAGLGLAVWDRLVRAAEGRVMDTQA